MNKTSEFSKDIKSVGFLSKIKHFITTNKIWSIVIVAIIIAAGYWGYKKIFPTLPVTEYTFERVSRGDLVVTVTGSGQVSTLSKVSIKPTTTGQTQTLGQIISVKVQNGDTVKAGQVVAVLDGKNALQTLNQAKASVESAQASYDKLVGGLTSSQLLSLNNSITSAQTSLDNSKQNILISLRNAYTTAANSVYLTTDPFFNNPMSVNPLIEVDGVNFINQDLQNRVNQDRYAIGPILNDWNTKIQTETTEDDMPTLLNQAIYNLTIIRNYFDDMTMLFGVYSVASDSSGQSAINSNKGIASGARSSIDSLISSLTSSLQSYNNSVFSLKQAKDNLAVQQEPPSDADLAVSQANLANAQANLANAETAYASRIITAPFDGQIGGLNAEVGQQVSSSDSLGTLITAQKVINVTLNEVDAAKISANDPVTITFDSLPNLSLKGHVAYIDPLGTVSQGVVSYSVQINMDEQNDQIKTAMTASVSIITTQHSNTLIIPTSAITTTGGKKYVLVADMSSSTMSQRGSLRNYDMASTTGFSTSSRINFASSTFSSTTRVMFSSSRQFGTTSDSSRTSTNITIQYPVSQVEITTGISNNTMTEVLSGLSEGELIVTKKTIVTGVIITAKTSASEATTNTRTGGTFRVGGGAFGGGAVGASFGGMRGE